ncbi:MoaD/ThiS family protein [Thalassotalea insulae]|nr:MoaD/ThiS family protein [Thalassotalea insulae]
MINVEMTHHLYRYFPLLENTALELDAGSIADVLHQINQLAPGFTQYILDDNGALRRHVNISINNQLLIDRKTLLDKVPDNAKLYIFQSLTGG